MFSKKVTGVTCEFLKDMAAVGRDVCPSAIDRIKAVVMAKKVCQTLQVLREDPIISIQEKEPSETRQGDSAIPGRADPLLRLAYNPEAGISVNEAFHNTFCTIRRTIVNNNRFPFGKCLIEK